LSTTCSARLRGTHGTMGKVNYVIDGSDLVRLTKTVFRATIVALIYVTTFLSSGCEKKTAATDPTAQSTPGSTKLLEAADLVGYDGKRLRKSVDHIREANQKHSQDIEKMAETGPDE
jgi:hypothetical protein